MRSYDYENTLKVLNEIKVRSSSEMCYVSKWDSGKLQKVLLKIYKICKQAEYTHFYNRCMSSVCRPSSLQSPLDTPHTHSQRLVCCGRSINIKQPEHKLLSKFGIHRNQYYCYYTLTFIEGQQHDLVHMCK